jgi:DNA repair exonuclease SbcCD ATPase subunit
MADTTTVMDTTADSVSKETYTETKRLADERAAKLANAEAKLQIYEAREREQLKAFQPNMESMIKELHDEAPFDHKAHFATMLDWTRTASERPNIDTQMQLGTVIHACASKLKRVREDASVQSVTAEQLANSSKELEAAKEALGAKDRRIGELSDSLKEIQANSEKLQAQLEKAGALSEKFDFSKATSREESPPATGENHMTKTTENASKGARAAMPTYSPTDALMNFAFEHGAAASSRFMPSVSNHAILGASGSESFASAIRPM